MSKNKKTPAKRMGVKSVLAHGDKKLAITTFGKGNDTEIAVNTDARGTDISPLPHKTGQFAVNRIDREIGIKSTGRLPVKNKKGHETQEYLETILNNPAEDVRQDYLGLKGTLEKEFFEKEFFEKEFFEKEFFEKEFPNDNIRIQIIHQILDIQKIIGLYVTDIIYCINNLRDEAHLDHESDIVGLSMNEDDKLKINLGKMLPYLGFFGDAFQMPPRPKTDKNGNIIEKETDEDKHNMAVLRILGIMRQETAHYREKQKPLFFVADSDLANKFKKHTDKNVLKWTAWPTVDQHYTQLVDRINKEFCEHAALNIQILFDLLKPKDETAKKKLVEEYYRFSVLKENKNQGVNLTTVREAMFKNRFYEVRSQDHDSYRSKFYGMVNFVLFREYTTNSAKTLERWTDKLRTSEPAAKDKLYTEFGNDAGMLLEKKINEILNKLSNYFSPKSGKVKKASDLKDEFAETYKGYLADIQIKNDATSLVKLLSFLCNFLEGKEINELLSAYIHKFENIQSFIDTLEQLGETVKFSNKYALFNQKVKVKDDEGNDKEIGISAIIASQLRVLASIGKMKPDLDGAKRQLYKAAIEMLGVPDDSRYITDEWLAENVLLDKSDKEAYDRKKKDVNPFRNFIAGNVISSRRFTYLVRYTKPKTVRALMQNRNIVHYVLSRIAEIQDVHMTESQINRYYKNLPQYDERQKVEREQKVDALADYLVKYSFEKNVLVQKNGIVLNTKSPQKNIEIERLKALTGLYLTVAYIAIKSLVKANARYYIAFAALERDHAMFEKKEVEDFKKRNVEYYAYTDANGKKHYCELLSLTEYFLDKDDLVRYVQDETKSDEENKIACRKFFDDKKIHHHFSKKWRDIFLGPKVAKGVTDAEKNDLTGKSGLVVREGGAIRKAKTISPTGWLLTAARNNAEHLNVLTSLPKYVGKFKGCTRKSDEKHRPRNLYFQLYHYISQCLLFEDEQLQTPLKEYADQVEKHGTPCSDLVNVTYVSLGYNLARYKNLTIEGLFEEQQ